MDFESAEDQAIKLLTRKVEKANKGDALVEDIRLILRETKAVVG